MIRAAKFLFNLSIGIVLAFFVYAVIYRIAEDISFWNAMGGGF